jgi:hypothetical protein
MSWFKIELSRQQVAPGDIARIQNALSRAFLALDDRPRVSLWAF